MSCSISKDIHFTVVKSASSFEKFLPSLRRLLQRCVNDDPSISSIGFLAELSDHEAAEYWLQLFPTAVGANPLTTLIIATIGETAEVAATVQITKVSKTTHAHRGEVKKLLVAPEQRQNGLGRRTMEEVERIARHDLLLEMLVLDTATATPARTFYLKTGWTEWGICPEYATSADGRKGDCSFFTKKLV